jgi:hypothetical protein
MYARILRKADHITRFTIRQTGAAGWEVREEQDSRVVRSARYRDWHRVERAQMVFALQAALLEDAGWTEA